MNCGRNRSTGTLWIINGICFALRLKGRDVGVVVTPYPPWNRVTEIT